MEHPSKRRRVSRKETQSVRENNVKRDHELQWDRNKLVKAKGYGGQVPLYTGISNIASRDVHLPLNQPVPSRKVSAPENTRRAKLHPRDLHPRSSQASKESANASVVQVVVVNGGNAGATLTQVALPVAVNTFSLNDFGPVTLEDLGFHSPSPSPSRQSSGPASPADVTPITQQPTSLAQSSQPTNRAPSSSVTAKASSTNSNPMSIDLHGLSSQQILSPEPSTPLPPSPSDEQLTETSASSFFPPASASDSQIPASHGGSQPPVITINIPFPSSGNSNLTSLTSSPRSSPSLTSSATLTSDSTRSKSTQSISSSLTLSSSRNQSSTNSKTLSTSNSSSQSSSTRRTTTSSSSSSSSQSASSTLTTSSRSSISASSSSFASSTQNLIGGGGAGGPTNAVDGASPSSTGGSGSGSGNSSAPSTPAVVGGVVGGVAGLTVILVLILLFFRWRRNKLGHPRGIPQPVPQTVPSSSADEGGTMTERSSAVPLAASGFFKRLRPHSGQTAATTDTAPSERGFQNFGGRKLESVLSSRGDGYGEPGPSSSTSPAMGFGPGPLAFRGQGLGHSRGPSEQETISGSSTYRDSQGFYAGNDAEPRSLPSSMYVGPGSAQPMSPTFHPPPSAGLPPEGVGGPSQRDSGIPIMRPSPARTPVTSQPGFTPLRDPPPPPRGIPSRSSPTADPAVRLQQDVLGRSHPSFDGSRGSKFTEEM